MATRGFENWTEADVAAHMARIRPERTETDQGATNGKSGVVGDTGASSSLLGHPDAIMGVVKPYTGHKYRAEPCIVTPDLTLFTLGDIRSLEADPKCSWDGCYPVAAWLRKASMRQRADHVGIVGEWFGSTKEGRRYIELRQLEKGGLVRNLRRQVPHELHASGARLGLWKSDFNYDERVPAENMARVEWRAVTEDCKGRALPLDKWKRAHVEAEYQITIRIT